MVDFDSRARQWDSNPVFLERALRVADGIRARVPLGPSTRALDFGCGTGLLSFALRDHVGHITLQDSSAGMLEVLREKIARQGVTNMTVREGEQWADLPPEGRYTLVYTSMTLHHIPDTDATLRAFHRALRPGGFLCVADLDAEDGTFHGPEVEVHHGFERGELARRAARSGFADLSFDTVFEMRRELAGEVRRDPVFLMVARRV